MSNDFNEMAGSGNTEAGMSEFDREVSLFVNQNFPGQSQRQNELDSIILLNPDLAVGLGDVRYENLLLFSIGNDLNAEQFARRLVGSNWGRAIYTEMMVGASGGSGGGAGVSREQQISNLMATLSSTSNMLGLGLSDEDLTTIANTAVDGNMDSAAITAEMFNIVDPSAIVSGDIKTLANELYNESLNVRSTLSDEEAMEYAIRIASGQMSRDTAIFEIREAAGQERPEYASLISRGFDLNDFDNLYSDIQNTVRRYGVAVTDDQIRDIATLAIERELNDGQIIDEIFNNFDESLGVAPGSLSAKQEEIINQARTYRLDITDNEALNLAIRFTRQELDDAGIDQILSTRASEETQFGDIIDLNIDINSYERTLASLTSSAQTLGIQLDDNKLANIARDAIQFEYSEQQATNALFDALDEGQGLVSGTILGMRNRIRQDAYNQRVVLSDAEATQLAVDMSLGNMDELGLQAFLDERAIEEQPDYQTEIEFGLDLNSIDTARASITDAISQFGLDPSAFDVNQLAQQAISNNWDSNQLTDAILSTTTINSAIGDGLIKQEQNKVKALARRYMVPMSDGTAMTYALQKMQGQITDDTLMSAFTDQAKSLFPFLNSTIEAGLTPGDYFEPAREVLANTLELNVEDIDLAQSDFMDLVTTTDESGTTRANSMTEIMQAARKDKRWANTSNARSAVTTAVSALSSMFGVRGF